MKKLALIILCTTIATGLFAQSQLPKSHNFWEQNHLQSDGCGGYYDHAPGTGVWQDRHITPDGNGGYYEHTPGTGVWQDRHITSDGHGGYYY